MTDQDPQDKRPSPSTPPGDAGAAWGPVVPTPLDDPTATAASAPPSAEPMVPGDPSPDSRPSGSGDRKTWLIAGAVAAVVAIVTVVAINVTGKNSSAGTTASVQLSSGGTGANGTRRPGFGNGISGTVAKIDGTTLTVEATVPDFRQGGNAGTGTATTYTVQTTRTTTFTKTESGKVDELAKGDTVLVLGENTNGTVAATRISQTDGQQFGGRPPSGTGTGGQFPGRGDPSGNGGSGNGAASGRGPGGFGGRGGGFTVGTIASINGSTLTVKSAAGDTVTVTTSSSTTISVTNKVTIQALAKGDQIQATGTVSGTTVKATSVSIGGLGGAGRDFGGFGGGAPPAGADPGTSGSATTTRTS